jgi:hypothetical protein
MPSCEFLRSLATCVVWLGLLSLEVQREVEGSFAPKAKLRDPCSSNLVHFFHRNFHSCSQLQILRHVALKFNCMV